MKYQEECEHRKRLIEQYMSDQEKVIWLLHLILHELMKREQSEKK